jgi:Fic family protein
MILNNYRTIQHIREIKEKTLTPERLTEIQKLMTSDTLDNPADEGRFRDNDDVRVIDVVDGEIMHQPPNVSQLPKLIEELCQFVNDDEERMFIHPIIKASIIHFLIGFIHPFVDGNGRTARALFYWYMLKKGYWLTEYLSISSIILKAKTQYANAFLLTETDENDLSYFIQFKIKTMKLAYAGLQKYLQRKIEEKKAATTFLTIGGINERQALLLQELTMEADKVLRVVELENRFGVSNQTARNDLKALKSLGLLKSTKINKKESIFSRSASFESRVEQLKSQSLA